MNYIYVIENTKTGRIYIGRTNNLMKRRIDHFSKLRRGIHNNPPLQAAFNKYGADVFVFREVDHAPASKIEQKEAEWFAKYGRNKRRLYNTHFETNGGPILIGHKQSQFTQKKKAATRELATRKFIFDVLDDRFDNKLTVRQLREKYNVHPETLVKFTPEWEQMRGLKMPRNVLHDGSKEKVAKLVEAYRQVGASVFNRHKEYGLALKTVLHYLPEFGLSEDALRREGWKTRVKATCPHCGKTAIANMIARWHGDNCKHKA